MAVKLSDLGRIIRQAVESKKVLEAAGKEAVESIPRRTRLGKGVKENDGPTHQLPELKTKTVRNRRLLKKKGELTGKGATPKKSGVNRTGAMLDSVDYEARRGELIIELSPEQQDKLTNLLKINDDYQFMRLSSAEFKRVLKAMTKQVDQILKGIKITDL